MPLKSGQLSKGESAFLDAFAGLGDVPKAERMAGIAAGTGSRILARPAIQTEMVQRQQARLASEALPIAITTLIEVMTNAKSPAAARVAAAKIVVDKGMPQDGDGRTKELHELTPEEIAKAIDTLTMQAATLAKPVPSGEVFD